MEILGNTFRLIYCWTVNSPVVPTAIIRSFFYGGLTLMGSTCMISFVFWMNVDEKGGPLYRYRFFYSHVYLLCTRSEYDFSAIF